MRWRRLSVLFLVLAIGSITRPLSARRDMDDALTVRAARSTLSQVMTGIARDIGALQRQFPQLKDWNNAEIASDRIEYQYHYKISQYPFVSGEKFDKNGCYLRITSKNSQELATATSSLPDELKVGVYLKMKASGEKAEELKKVVQEIIAKRFESVRKLKGHTL